MSEDNQELVNACLVTAAGLIEDDYDDDEPVYCGRLELIPAEEPAGYDVFVVVQEGEDEVKLWIDRLVPSRFKAARLLGGYLRRLQEIDAEYANVADVPGIGMDY